MAVLALMLGIGGGVALTAWAVIDLPPTIVAFAAVAWLASLVLVVVDAVARSRRDDTTFLAAAGAGAREAGRWLRDFMPV